METLRQRRVWRLVSHVHAHTSWLVFTSFWVAATLADEKPTFESSAHLVQVVVSLTNQRGEPVDGLRAGEFQIADEGVVQPIAFFQPPVYPGASIATSSLPAGQGGISQRQGSTEHGTSPTVEAEAALRATQHLLIVLEPMRLEVRQKAIRAIRKFFTTSETAAAYAVSLIDGARLVQPFVNDKAQTLRALAEIAARREIPARIVPLNNCLGPTVDALQGLARVPGQKSMVLFLDFNVPTPHALFPELAIRSNVVLYPVDARGLVGVVPFGEASAEYGLGSGLASGGAWAGPLIAADLMARTSVLGQQSLLLRSVEEATGGRRLVNDNDLGRIFRLMEENSRGRYVLGYYMSESIADGRFHRVKIKVTRPGVTVRAKEGYFAPNPASPHSLN